MKLLILLLLLFFPIINTYALNVQELSESDEWHNLLLDDPSGNGFINNDTKFFACGKRDYKAEIEFLLDNQNEELYKTYPARYECISRNLNINIPYLENNKDLQQFLQDNDYNSASIALVEPYNQTLMSLFGHSFLFLSNNDENLSDGVAINLYAHIDHLNSFDVIKKGLDGSLDGYFDLKNLGESFEGYLVKMERGIIDYKTTLNKDQIKRLLLMIYELNNAPISYQFVTKNCVNATLNLLDYAYGNIAIRKQHPENLVPTKLPIILEELNFIENISVYSPVVTQLGHEINESRIPELDERKKAWDEEGWKIKGYDHKQGKFIPIKDEINRPFYFNNNFHYIKSGITFDLKNKNKISGELEARFFLADDWERIFSTKKLCEVNLGKVNLFYEDKNNWGVKELTLFEKNTYPKLMKYHMYPTKKFMIGGDRNFSDNKFRMQISYGIGFSVGTPHTLLYSCLNSIAVFDYIGLNIEAEAGAMVYGSWGNIRIKANYPFYAIPNKLLKNTRINISSNLRLNDSIIINSEYGILSNKLKFAVRYCF